MFGLFKPKLAPEGPVEFNFELEINRPASEVYRLLDWSDENNAKRATGSIIRPIPGAPGRFDMVWSADSELLFKFKETLAPPGEAYAFDCEIEPRVGKLDRSVEEYRLTPTSPESCKVELINTVTFVERLTMKQFQREIATMAHACQQSLVKLKIQAEHGTEIAAELEGKVLAA